MKRVAAQKASYRKPATADCPVVLQTTDRVPGTRGLEPTHGPEQPRERLLIDADQENEKLGEHESSTWRGGLARRPGFVTACRLAPRALGLEGPADHSPERARRTSRLRSSMLRAARRHSRTTSGHFRSLRAWRTITTTSNPGGHKSREARNASRTSRLARFLVTALPTRRETVTPSRAEAAECSAPSGARGRGTAKSSTKCGVTTRRAFACTCKYSERLRTRCWAGNAPGTPTSCRSKPSGASGPSGGGP